MTEILLRWVAIIVLVATAIMASIQLSSNSWPHVRGVVEHGNWHNADSLNGQAKGYNVTYAYEVNGRAYKGSDFGWAATSSTILVLNGRDNSPEELTPREGHQVNVFYAQWLPSLSVLVPGPSPRLWIWVAVGVLMSALLIGAGRVSNHPLF